MLLGLIIGVVSGVLQYWMLSKFTGAVTGGALDNKAVLFGVGQFLLPLAVLLCCAFVLNDSLLWAAIGMAASLTLCALARFVIARSADRTQGSGE